MAHEGGGKVDTDLLPAGEGVDVSVPILLRKAEPGQDLFRHRLIIITA